MCTTDQEGQLEKGPKSDRDNGGTSFLISYQLNVGDGEESSLQVGNLGENITLAIGSGRLGRLRLWVPKVILILVDMFGFQDMRVQALTHMQVLSYSCCESPVSCSDTTTISFHQVVMASVRCAIFDTGSESSPFSRNE